MSDTGAVLAVAAGLVGLAVGSFLTVVVSRLPAGLSLVTPPSRCPACLTPIGARDNVPVVSYLLRRGRCRSCGARIPARYVLLELATAACFVGVSLRLPVHWFVPAYCIFLAGLLALAVIDLDCQRLPTPLVLGTGAAGAPLLLLAWGVTGSWSGLLHGAVAGAACTALFGLLFLAVPRGMGFGDVRLAGLCGAYLGVLGYRVAAVGVLVAFLSGGLVGIVLLAGHRVSRKTRLPFGPFLCLGALVAVLAGPALARLWLGG